MLARLVYMAFNVYALGLIVYSACTWVQHPQASRVRAWLHRWYDPVLGQLRRIIRPVQMGTSRVDFAPLALLVGIMVVRRFVASLFIVPH